MDFLLQNWLLILVALSSGGMLVWNARQSGGTTIGPTDAVSAINRSKAVVVDVDTQSTETIKGAKRIAIEQLEAELDKVVKNKSLPVIFVCAAGNRSRKAVSIAKKLGYEKACGLQGGLQAWKQANLPTQTAAVPTKDTAKA